MNIIAPVFAPQFRTPMPADLQEIIREKMMATVPAEFRWRPEPRVLPPFDRGAERRKQLTPAAVAAHASGLPLNKMAILLGCSSNTVVRILKEAGVWEAGA